MDDGKNKLAFFDDIRTQALLVLGGIVSLATVIPAFLNSTAEILGWENIRLGFYLFVFLYFIIPYLFYLLYCSIHDDVGYLILFSDYNLKKIEEKGIARTAIDIAVPLVALIYLIWSACPYEQILSLLLYIAGPFCSVYFGIIYYRHKALFKEFLIISVVVFISFLFFLANMFREMPAYSSAEQTVAFEAYKSTGILKKDIVKVLDVSRKEAYKYRTQAALKHPELEKALLNRDNCINCGIGDIYKIISQVDVEKNLTPDFLKSTGQKLQAALKNTLEYDKKLVEKNDASLYHVDEIYQAFVYLSDYSQSIQKAKLLKLNDEWAQLLKNLQFKSMIWFQFLILLGLCLWLKLQCSLVGLNLISYKEQQKITDKKTDSIGQVKSLILLLIVLTVPWLRHIDTDNIDVERPFLNAGLSTLVGTPPPTIVKDAEKCCCDTAHTINVRFTIPVVDTTTRIQAGKRDTVYYPLFTSFPYIPKSDSGFSSLLKRIEKKVDTMRDTLNAAKKEMKSEFVSTKNKIREQAKRTIGNKKDRNF